MKFEQEVTFFVLFLGIALHVFANALAEVRGGTGRIAAMFSGRKATEE